jgi:D-arabinose 1-dehydrogenase-like Zn-dependent alcohol dehydrogenase
VIRGAPYADLDVAPLLWRDSSAIAPCVHAALASASASTDSDLPRTSLRRLQPGKDSGSTPSLALTTRERNRSRSLGATWAAGSDERAPVPLDAAIIFAAAGELVPIALRAVRKGGTVVCGGIHMSDIPGFPYADWWGERSVRSIANLTRQDAAEFLALAPRVPVRTQVTLYPLRDANRALADLRDGRLTGSAVITVA